jgi:hypothetical protein
MDKQAFSTWHLAFSALSFLVEPDTSRGQVLSAKYQVLDLQA